MDNLRNTIELLFSRRKPDDLRFPENRNYTSLLENTQQVDKLWFEAAFCSEYPRYSKEEVLSLYAILQTTWLRPPNQDQSRAHCFSLSVFNPLIHFDNEILKEENAEPVCKFDALLRWHELTDKLGEDIFTTSYFAYQDYLRGVRNRRHFAWKWHVTTDNRIINEICKRKLADIHYHLNISSMIFDLNWLSLMNNITNRDSAFLKITKSLHPVSNLFADKRTQCSLHALCIKAAAIRLLLFLALKQGQDILANNEVKEINNICLSCDEKEMALYLFDLQRKIDYFKFFYGKKYDDFTPDYAILSHLPETEIADDGNGANAFLYGERYLLYQMFTKIYAGDKLFLPYAGLFYEYLLIKAKFRGELIQLNDRIGFDNFGDYQERKDWFVKDTLYEKLIPYLAIRSSFTDHNVRYIEARMGLGNTIEKFNKTINSTDKKIRKQYFYRNFPAHCLVCPKPGSDCSIKKTKHNTLGAFPYYYIVQLHKGNQYAEDFAYALCKKNDRKTFCSGFQYKNQIDKENSVRNDTVRKKAKETVWAYNELRKSSLLSKRRVVGIDAVSSEYGCRPEVFAQAYRYLRNYSYPEINPLDKDMQFTKVGFSYHVGEYFSDLTDGIRAIDEALLFLELKHGDRIGHALALGIEAKEYYAVRKHTVVLPMQEMLDNIVWLLYKSEQYGIMLSPKMNAFLKSKFYEYYTIIYDNVLKLSNISDPFTYYQSMLLRGDAPDLYHFLGNKENKIAESKGFVSYWDLCGLSVSNPEIINARNSEMARRLYYFYHNSAEVKYSGCQSVELKFPEDYAIFISKMQNKIMKLIASKGIGIETNPSSNYKIAQLKRYDKHPIVKFFNLGLTYKEEEITVCPQITVSINTDDQGIFSTNLENEYALLALALSKKKDIDGKPLYTERMIYDWLERIRQMGWEQRFVKNDNQ